MEARGNRGMASHGLIGVDDQLKLLVYFLLHEIVVVDY
jgi:hypothetical protein